MLVHLGIDVAGRHEQIEPSVVVEVDKAVAPADKGDGRLRQACAVADIGKAGVAVVVEEHFVVVAEIADKEVHLAVVLVVAGGNAHGRNLAAVVVERETRQVAVVFKGAVALVDVEIVGCGVIAHHEVWLAVALQINKD